MLCTTAGCGSQQATAKSEAPVASIPGGPSKTTDTEHANVPKDAPKAAPRSDPAHPKVVIETSMGLITLILDKENAPLTVDHFLSYVARNQYNDTIIHEVYRDHAILGGGYTVDRKEVPARRTVRCEADRGLKNVRGTIGLFRQPDRIDSAKCQFYINVVDNKSLDYQDNTPEKYGYCVFGRKSLMATAWRWLTGSPKWM